MKKIFFIISLLSFNLSASVPSVEGLFRNSNNAEIAGDLVVLKFSISREKEVPHRESIEIVEKPIESMKVEGELATGEDVLYDNFYVKFIFSLENPERISLLQAVYSDGKMDPASLVDVKLIDRVITRLDKENYPERNIFYSLMLSLTLNNSTGISQFLKKSETRYIENKELVNVEKKDLYKGYIEYLKEIKENKELVETLVNPMKPVEVEEVEKIAETLKLPMYKDTEFVTLIKDQGKFFWQVQLDNFMAKFSNEKHRLKQVEFNTLSGNIKVSVGEFLLFNGVNELPRKLLFKDANENIFNIRVLDFDIYSIKNKGIRKRHTEYMKVFSENSEKLKLYTPVSKQQLFIF